MNTYRYRLGEPGVEYTKAGYAVLAMKLADTWFHVDEFAFVDTVRLYLTGAAAG